MGTFVLLFTSVDTDVTFQMAGDLCAKFTLTAFQLNRSFLMLRFDMSAKGLA